MIPITIVDNFYNDPYKIRELALAQTYTRHDGAYWPGLRSPMLLDIDNNLYDKFIHKLLSVFFNLPGDQLGCNIDVFFQTTSEQYEEGWTHIDTDVSFAGVIYLTPEPLLDSGTSIYQENTVIGEYDQSPKVDFYNGKTSNLDEYRTLRNTHNLKFTKTMDIANVFNRLVVFSGNDWHKENNFFGSTLDDSRLTQVFFVKLSTYNNTNTPIIRVKTVIL
jgi:hypothetical protein